MSLYLDASVLLSLVKHDSHAARAFGIWKPNTELVSSILLEAECFVSLRRAYTQNKGQLSAHWLLEREEVLAQHLDEIELKKVDEEVVDQVKRIPILAQCRSLDAIHVATALLFQSVASDDFTFFTFDERQAAVAKAVGLKIQTHQ